MVFFIISSNLWTYGFIILINEKLNKENKLEKEKFQLIFNTNLDGQLITQLENGLIIDVNDEFVSLMGYSRDEIIGKSTEKINLWDSLEDRRIFTEELNNNGFCKNMEFVFQRKNKNEFNGMISAKIITISSKTHIIAVIRDITERKEFERALIESEEKYHSILKASPNDITIADLAGSIEMISPVAKEMFGYDSDFDDFIGMQLLEFIVAEDVKRAKKNILKMYNGAKQSVNEYRGVRKDKSVFDIEVNSGLIYNANSEADKIVFIIRDITKRKLVEEKMNQLVQQLEVEKNTAQLNAITDSMTGLYNRGFFDKTLRTEFFRLMRSGSPLSLIMIYIDHFKMFNDNYGHLAGDKCIQEISTMLKSIVTRASDVVARYGGEEFILILPETYEDGAKILGNKIRKSVEKLAIAHEKSETSKYVTVSVGVVTVYPDELYTPDQALKLVDETLYRSKENGRNNCVYASNIK